MARKQFKEREAFQVPETPSSPVETSVIGLRITPAVALGAVILAAGIVMRIAYLGDRPLHHDESIHATLSHQWFENPDRSFYKYDPTYHGPLLYAMLRLLYPLFGTGAAQARLFPLLFGLGVLFTPLLFRRFYGRTAAWCAVAAIAVSPLFVYYARFLAHDMPSVFFAVLGAAFLARFRESFQAGDDASARSWLCEAAVAFGLFFSVKAVAFLYLFIYLTFAFFCWAYDRFPNPFPKNDPNAAARRAGTRKTFFLAACLFFASYAVVQTSFFSNPDGFLDGLYRKVFPYWWGQHTIERVVGPTTFHLRSMLLHELPITLLVFAMLCLRLWREQWGRVALGALGIIALVTVPVPWDVKNTIPEMFSSLLGILKMRSSPDIFLYSAAFVFGILGGYQYLQECRRGRAFLVYWFFSSLAIYSYIGEKAPWLTPHVVYPAALLAGCYLSDLWNAARTIELSAFRRQFAMVLVAFAVFYQVRIAYLVTFVTAGEPTDLLSQVHNTRDVRFVVDWMRRVSYETGERPEGIPIAIIGQPVWAFYFHLIEFGFKHFTLETSGLDGTQRFIIVDEPVQKEVNDKLTAQGYRMTKLNHSGWWVPEHATVTWGAWLDYAITRRPPTPIGLTHMWVYYKPIEASPVRLTAAVSSGSESPPVHRTERKP